MNQPPNEPTSESTSDAKEKELIEKAAKGDSGAIGNLLTRHSQRIKRMLAVRLDPRIRARLDESDVYQELQIEATRRLPEFLAERSVSFFVEPFQGSPLTPASIPPWSRRLARRPGRTT